MKKLALILGLVLGGLARDARADPFNPEVCVLVTQCVDTPGADRAKCLKGYGVTTGQAKKCQKVSDDMIPPQVRALLEKRQPGRGRGREK